MPLRVVPTLGACLALCAVRPSIAQSSSGDDAQRKAVMFQACQQLDLSADQTVQGIRDRTDCWKRMQLQGLGDSAVDVGYRRAVADYDAAITSDSLRRAADSVELHLTSAQRALDHRDLVLAQRDINAVLAVQPDNQRALAFRERIDGLMRAAERQTRLRQAALFTLLAALICIGLSLWLTRRHARSMVRIEAIDRGRRAVVEIVDGVGRGKMYTLDAPLFRIGSAASDRPEERNDLVLSDGEEVISRFHCVIIRKEGRFYLVDSSLNGTYLDDDLLARGEHRELEDGAEFSLAGVARMKFLLL